MHDFSCWNPDDMNYDLMRDAARYYKENPEGVEIMCKQMEDMRADVEQRTKLEAIKNIMEGLKYSAEQAMELLKIPAAEQQKYIAKL